MPGVRAGMARAATTGPLAFDARGAVRSHLQVTRIRLATLEDAAAIAQIYAPYVSDTAISFETEVVGTEQMAERMQAFDGLYPWFVAAEAGDAVIGYAYATQFRTRAAYRFAAETTVYLESTAQGRGLGTLLYRALLDQLIRQGFTQ